MCNIKLSCLFFKSLGPAVQELHAATFDTLEDIEPCLATLGSYDGWNEGQLLSLFTQAFAVKYLILGIYLMCTKPSVLINIIGKKR